MDTKTTPRFPLTPSWDIPKSRVRCDRCRAEFESGGLGEPTDSCPFCEAEHKALSEKGSGPHERVGVGIVNPRGLRRLTVGESGPVSVPSRIVVRRFDD